MWVGGVQRVDLGRGSCPSPGRRFSRRIGLWWRAGGPSSAVNALRCPHWRGWATYMEFTSPAWDSKLRWPRASRWRVRSWAACTSSMATLGVEFVVNCQRDDGDSAAAYLPGFWVLTAVMRTALAGRPDNRR